MPEDSSAAPFAACARTTLKLADAIRELVRVAEPMQLAPLDGREWYEVLSRKLLPQLDDDPFLVVAVVGGTNIGKSVVFNHIAGFRASATSPLASGTKHPVCLVPEGFGDLHDLGRIFAGFERHEWSDADLALETHEEHRLYVRASTELPPNLLVLDTPDIDSDAPVNWLRADRIRACADVLVAVLTQQKYNDAAVKQFFRKAAAEDKAVIVVFNQVLLPEDEQFWPLWLQTFTRETGVQPDLVYISSNDRRAAEENRLPFFPRQWPAQLAETDNTPRSLGEDLARLHFSAIKLRTLRGSLSHLVSESGVPAFLKEVRAVSAQFQSAAELLSAQRLAQVDNWPAPPTSLLVSQIREWWRTQREGWTRTIHDVYGTIGNGILIPFRWAYGRVAGEPPDPIADYRRQEWDVILQVVNQLYDELGRLSQLGNELLRPRLERLLAGNARVALLQDLAKAHEAVDFTTEFTGIVDEQMKLFVRDNPGTFGWLRRIDSVAAAARPVTSVALFAFAAGPVGHILTDAAASTLVHIVGDVAGGTGAVVVGEAALAQSATGLRQVEARLRQLHTACIARRVAWFAGFLRERVLGQLQVELESGSKVPEAASFRIVQECVEQLRKQLPSVTQGHAP